MQLSDRAPAGSCAGTMLRQLGGNKTHFILRITIDGKNYVAHRLAFLYMLGPWPIGGVDRKNRNPMDYRWKDLREGHHVSNKVLIKANEMERLSVTKEFIGANATKFGVL